MGVGLLLDALLLLGIQDIIPHPFLPKTSGLPPPPSCPGARVTVASNCLINVAWGVQQQLGTAQRPAQPRHSLPGASGPLAELSPPRRPLRRWLGRGSHRQLPRSAVTLGGHHVVEALPPEPAAGSPGGDSLRPGRPCGSRRALGEGRGGRCVLPA